MPLHRPASESQASSGRDGERMNAIPGPRIPRAVFELNLMARPLQCLDSCARRYGDPFKVGGNRRPAAVYFSSPTAIQQIMTADPDTFEPRKGEKVLRYLLGDNAVQYLVGPRHQRSRRLLSPPFHGEWLRSYAAIIQRVVDDQMRTWTPGAPFLVHPFMQQTTLRVISHAVFGPDRGPRLEQLRRQLAWLLDRVSTRSNALLLSWAPRRDWGPVSPWGWLARQKRRLDALIVEELRERRSAGTTSDNDVVSLLLADRDAEDQPRTETELRDEVMSLLFAGHETTTSALTWALYRIHQVPEVHEKLRRDIAALGGDADPTRIAELPYLAAIGQETLRLYPGVVALIRTLKFPMEVTGYRLEAGTELIPCIYLTHRRAELYDEPDRFWPDRFLKRDYSPYEFLPFGVGGRRCIGMSFALFEMKLVLATILAKWHLAVNDRTPMKPLRRGVFAGPPPGMQILPVRTTASS
jgi:cytochrome P450